MGLDIFLYKKNPRYTEEEAFATYKALPYEIWKEMAEKQPEWKPIEEIAYWRKANMVHGFFMTCKGYWVEGIGNEDDHDCGYKHIPISELERLLDTCKTIVDNGFNYNGKHLELTAENLEEKDAEDCKPFDIELCEEYLPTERGFFYGSYDYDGWYLSDVVDTYEMLTKLKKDGEFSGDIYYHPWW